MLNICNHAYVLEELRYCRSICEESLGSQGVFFWQSAFLYLDEDIGSVLKSVILEMRCMLIESQCKIL